MYKKRITSILLLIVLMFTVVLSGCGQESEDTSSDSSNAEDTKSQLELIKERGKLVLGTCADYPPYEFHKEIDGKDTIVGFDISIGKEIAKDLGVELEIKDMQFKGLLPALKTGKIDMILAGMTPKPERREEVDFSDIYYNALHGVIIRVEDQDTYKTLEDLTGKAIGAQKAAIQEDLARENIKDAEIKALGKVSDLILQLKNKRAEAVIVEEAVAQAYINKNEDLSLMDLRLQDQEGGSAVAVNKDNPDFVEAINKTIERLNNEDLINKFVVEATEMSEND
ncbi:ABC transporter substrate-binding protein [Clostridiisalibacter paucivorans]|uniref:ABC transporter substrate-binding protein n=1 Tax=Clostridiisalibacter paucivorans TaxID=408753 RepID=UPI00047A108E|nr:ABC transporter substrate-binding protein [Clostridiisalibacter paucivorans]